MERLTHYDEDGRIYSSRGWEVSLSHLAAYEDTGMEPEEIKQMCALARLNSNIFDNDFGNHIAELIVAERDGRLVVLPCKVGDTVYILRGDVHNGYETVKKTHVEKVAGGFTIGMLNRNTMKMYDYYYLTRAEAEAALGKEAPNE